MQQRNTTQRDKDRAAIRKTGAGCWICGQPIDYSLPYRDPGEFVVDHKIPRARGGADDLSNKAAAHRECNLRKLDKDFADIVKRSGALK